MMWRSVDSWKFHIHITFSHVCCFSSSLSDVSWYVWTMCEWKAQLPWVNIVKNNVEQSQVLKDVDILMHICYL